MAATLNGSASITFSDAYNLGTDGGSSVSVVSAGPSGSNAAILPAFGLVYGTGTVIDSNGMTPVNSRYVWQGTIATTVTKSIDLTGGSDTDSFGTALAFTHVKFYIVGLIAPDGINSLQVGPKGVSNAWDMGFGGVTSAIYITTYGFHVWCGPAAGQAVTASTADLFLVRNPSAGTVTAFVYIAGKK